MFTEGQLQRYSRQIILPEFGEQGQAKLFKARVFIVGAGGLGSPVGYYLSAAGVGTIAIIDSDKVELSNLQRQISHSSRAIGKPKVESAKSTFESLNPDVRVVAIKERLTKHNILDLIKDYYLVVDCSDNYETRFLVNDACVIAGKKLVTGAISKFEGQLTVVEPGESPCYRCLFEGPPPSGVLPSPQDVGILGAIAGVIGTLQATEVLKIITGIGHILKGELLIYDALKPSFRMVKTARNPDCAICGEKPTIVG
jgi:molybdopterin/thiamine biosynthesis adenylyltransferase